MELFDNDQTILQQQLEMISIMSRLDYNKTCALLCTCFDDLAQQYQQVDVHYLILNGGLLFVLGSEF
jgi:hypothetical protein